MRFSRSILLIILGAMPLAAHAQKSPASMWVFIATKSPAISGIARMRLNLSTGELTPWEMAASNVPVSFLALHPNQRFLYVVGNFKGEDEVGTVSALAIDAKTGNLTLLNQQPSGGKGPCHLAIDRNGKSLLVANYAGGTIAVFPLASDGNLAPASQVIQQQGHGPNKSRQEQAHPHFAGFDPTGKLALFVDLGTDKIDVYDFDAAAGSIWPHDPAFASVAPGNGPRHLDFHPNGRIAYVVNELKSLVTVFSYDSSHGSFSQIQEISTLPTDFHATNYPAEIYVHPCGKFLYCSNRGHDSIAFFSIDSASGKLSPLGHQSTQGHWPRQFSIDPTGNFLFDANEKSSNLLLYRIDNQTGGLSPVKTIAIPTPFCVTFLPVQD